MELLEARKVVKKLYRQKEGVDGDDARLHCWAERVLEDVAFDVLVLVVVALVAVAVRVLLVTLLVALLAFVASLFKALRDPLLNGVAQL